MKYLVISDNHGDREILVKIFNHYKNKVDAIFHCGDSELPSDDSIWNGIDVVKGNCDYSSGYPNTVTKVIGSDSIFMTHGHLFSVNSGLETVKAQAKQNGSNIVFYGHTHRAKTNFEDNLLFVNPGSISQPRGISKKTFAIVQSTVDAYTIQFFTESLTPVPELRIVYEKK